MFTRKLNTRAWRAFKRPTANFLKATRPCVVAYSVSRRREYAEVAADVDERTLLVMQHDLQAISTLGHLSDSGSGCVIYLCGVDQGQAVVWDQVTALSIIIGVDHTDLCLAPAHHLADVSEADLGPFTKHHVLGDLGPLRPILLTGCQVFANLDIC
nr:hypothetical protein [Pseudomonas fluorescens]